MMGQTDSQHSVFDSGRQHLGVVYAQGLLGAAENHQAVPRILEQFDSLIEDVLDPLPKFERLLESPRVDLETKLEVLEKAFASRMSPLLLNFLKVVAEHGRLDCLRPMRTAFRTLYNEAHGRVEIEICTANRVDRPLLEQIVSQLSATLGREVEVKSRIDPDLLGGMVVRVGDTVFDGSLKKRLDHMRSNALDRTTELVRESLQRFIGSE